MYSLKLPRHSSGKQSQATTDLDDVFLASSKLTKINRIPLIYCKAPDLVKLPPVAPYHIIIVKPYKIKGIFCAINPIPCTNVQYLPKFIIELFSVRKLLESCAIDK